jgi:hypothetical protein
MDKNKFWLGGRPFNTASRHVRKLGGPTHVRNANARHVRNAIANARQGTSANANANANARHARNANARHVHNARHVRTSASWPPQRNPRHIRKMVAQTQNSSATKTSTQGSTRIKDELEDG